MYRIVQYMLALVEQSLQAAKERILHRYSGTMRFADSFLCFNIVATGAIFSWRDR